ncbi:unnamed protein product [Didymodactylos carnosus]|uniref:Uncharacterized protein n=1 Tax=Didymodactylos carnosus TaxID=1234261 RepID=A0A815P0S2_9BILA|nr:unnamed protein product [Didymodactylos carnosus]CAF1442115.1 unnamed protein product [Didymodactylos carnosus]CAF4024397.1 unnamed protein product [Didymodactylos carnosus]CAF4317822.1 unnamed protein product [Didymodactylos carnosus]
MFRTCTHIANGVGWSWGFVNEIDMVNRAQADISLGPNPDLRLSWNTYQNQTGYRCGSTIMNDAATEAQWIRYIWHTN